MARDRLRGEGITAEVYDADVLAAFPGLTNLIGDARLAVPANQRREAVRLLDTAE
jgi:hypothetical protein